MANNVTVSPRYSKYKNAEIEAILDKANADHTHYTDISIDELTAGTLSDATVQKLIIMRNSGNSGDVVMLVSGDTYVAAVLQSYGSTFEMCFLDNRGSSARLGRVTANADNTQWAVEMTNVVKTSDLDDFVTKDDLTEASEESVRAIVTNWTPGPDPESDSE